jgi:hypothetical protein
MNVLKFFCFLPLISLLFSVMLYAQEQEVENSNGPKVKVGGFVKTDVFHDFDPIDSRSGFKTNAIIVGDRPAEIPASQTIFTARTSRLDFQLIGQTRWGEFFTRIEGDFASGSSNTHQFRLRHAYGVLGLFLVGQTWSTFVSEEALPFTLDFDGAASFANFRQPQVRVSLPISHPWNSAASLEQPESDITAPDTAGIPVTRLPDFIGRFRWDKDIAHLQFAALVRDIGYQAANGNTDWVIGWGLNFSGSFNTWGRDKVRFELNAGEGIGRYIGDLGGTGSDAAPDANENLEALPAFGGSFTYEKRWAEYWFSNIVLAITKVKNSDGQPDDAYHRIEYASANILYTPIERGLIGVEVLYGRRFNKDKQDGTALRVLVTFKYTFSYDLFTR